MGCENHSHLDLLPSPCDLRGQNDITTFGEEPLAAKQANNHKPLWTAAHSYTKLQVLDRI